MSDVIKIGDLVRLTERERARWSYRHMVDAVGLVISIDSDAHFYAGGEARLWANVIWPPKKNLNSILAPPVLWYVDCLEKVTP